MSIGVSGESHRTGPTPLATTVVPGLPIAFLVDGDNATAGLIKQLLEEASKYGTLVIRRVYGDWTSTMLGPWKRVLQVHALSPIQQFANVSGKNATDSALIIDAMDILHSGVVRGFCIVSSDSDYTRLAMRIRESGLFVLGMGRESTPPAFVNACNVFVSVENLIPGGESSGTFPMAPEVKAASPSSRVTGTTDEEPAIVTPRARLPLSDALPVLRRAYASIVGEASRVHLANLGAALLNLDPAFDSRTFGRAKLIYLLESFPEEFLVERHPERGPGTVYIQMKEQTRTG